MRTEWEVAWSQPGQTNGNIPTYYYTEDTAINKKEVTDENHPMKAKCICSDLLSTPHVMTALMNIDEKLFLNKK